MTEGASACFVIPSFASRLLACSGMSRGRPDKEKGSPCSGGELRGKNGDVIGDKVEKDRWLKRITRAGEGEGEGGECLSKIDRLLINIV